MSGIRAIVYFESDVSKVSDLITEAFCIDPDNSLDQDDLLSTDQIGYRSVHFVCDLGEARSSLPEFKELTDLKFEIQVRTVLQHAWAELAHDRNYKFSGKLPREIERKLFLYAGMLEIADKGFDDVSSLIDNYISDLEEKQNKGDLNTEINSVSLKQFISSWCHQNEIPLKPDFSKDQYSELVDELHEFGINTISELKDIIPESYPEFCRHNQYFSTVYGFVRDWMLIYDWRKFLTEVPFNWVLTSPELFSYFFDKDEYAEFAASFEWDDDESTEL